ncbi:hypothetical protein [Diplocloster hominis]|uniref:hypothetical protein n=1 Tax=Diplocloster hominis TaxID=3079010 RepID=UPI0031B9FF6F
MEFNFNPNELILERIRAVEAYNPATDELIGRLTQIEEPVLETSATALDVVDAMGTPIHTFYNAQQGKFSGSNSLFSLDLAASQFGAEKVVATADNKITMYASETVTIGSDATVVLKHVPVGASGAEIKYVKVINDNNTFGETYEVAAAAGAGKFTLAAATKTITLPEGTTGRVFVNYAYESDNAVSISKSTDKIPEVQKLLIHAIFHDPCDANLVYAGIIVCPRAQLDPTAISLSLKSDGKHPFTYSLKKPYCADSAKLFDILVSRD